MLDLLSNGHTASWWGSLPIYRSRQADPLDFNDKFKAYHEEAKWAVDLPKKIELRGSTRRLTCFHI